MDPYKVLYLDPSVSIDEVHKAYMYICKLYQAGKDRGCSKLEFIKFKKAYHAIIDAPRDFHALRNQPALETNYSYQFNDDLKRNFNPTTFNQTFVDHNEIQQGKDRCAAEYHREYAAVTAEVETITPFANGRYNNHTFNHAFQDMKDMHNKDKVYGDPAASVSNVVDSCENFENPKNISEGNFYDLNQAYNCHGNPNNYSKTFAEKFKSRPDITKDIKISDSEINKKINSRHNTPLVYNKDPLVTDRTIAKPRRSETRHPPQTEYQQPHAAQDQARMNYHKPRSISAQRKAINRLEREMLNGKTGN